MSSPFPSLAERATEARRLGALMLTAFVDTLGSFLVLALLPFYAEDFGATPQQVGLLVSAFAVAQMVTAPLWGRLSDRWGRRPVILLGMALSIAAFLVFAYARSLPLLLLARFAQGIAGGTVSVVFAYLSESVAPERRAEGIGWLTAATSAAAMIGPAIGSFAGRYDPSYPGLVAAGLAAVGLVIAWRLLPEPHKAAPEGAPKRPLFGALTSVVRQPLATVHQLIWIYALGMLATNAMTAVAGLYLDRRFGIDERGVWWFFTTLAGISLLTRVLLLGPMVRLLGEVRLLRLGVLLFALGLLSVPWPQSPWGLGWSVALIAVGSSFLYPCTTSLVSKSPGSAADLGQVMGVQQAYGGMSRIAGPILAGLLFQQVGPAAPFVGAGSLMVVLALLSWTGLSVEKSRASICCLRK